MRHRGFLLTLLILLAWPAWAEEYEVPATLEAAVRDFVMEHLQRESDGSLASDDVEIAVSNLDPRLRLAACGSPIRQSVNSPRRNSSNISVKLNCDGPKRWSIYVPVRLDIYAEIAVLSRSLARGTILTEQDVSLTRMNTAQAGSGYIEDLSRTVGMELKRPLQSGEPLRLSHLKPAQIVSKGDKVILEAGSNGLSVVTAGQALGSGQLGDNIKVRNTGSDRVIDAQIVAPGKVRISL